MACGLLQRTLRPELSLSDILSLNSKPSYHETVDYVRCPTAHVRSRLVVC